MSTQPIGLLDSGFGGLSVMSAVREEFPHEHLIYAGDCGYAPWGDRDDAFIMARTNALVDFLLSKGIKALVLACNTATAVAATALRARLSIPVIGIEPAILPAARATKTQVVGVMATVKTIASTRYQKLKAHVQDPNIRFIDCPCPGLMECVEAGAFHTEETRSMLKHFIRPMLDEGIDQLVLACTHYPFLSDEISRITGHGVSLINPAPAVARHLRTVLLEHNMLNADLCAGNSEYYVTGANSERARVLHALTTPEAALNELES